MSPLCTLSKIFSVMDNPVSPKTASAYYTDDKTYRTKIKSKDIAKITVKKQLKKLKVGKKIIYHATY